MSLIKVKLKNLEELRAYNQLLNSEILKLERQLLKIERAALDGNINDFARLNREFDGSLSSARGIIVNEYKNALRLRRASKASGTNSARESGDRLVREFDELTKGGKKELSHREKQILLAKARTPMHIKDWLPLKKFSELARQTGVEWSMQDLFGRKYLIAGKRGAVLVLIDKSVTTHYHTHILGPVASADDYDIFKKLLAKNPSFNGMYIVLRGEPFHWTKAKFEFFDKAGLLKRAEDIIED